MGGIDHDRKTRVGAGKSVSAFGGKGTPYFVSTLALRSERPVLLAAPSAPEPRHLPAPYKTLIIYSRTAEAPSRTRTPRQSTATTRPVANHAQPSRSFRPRLTSSPSANQPRPLGRLSWRGILEFPAGRFRDLVHAAVCEQPLPAPWSFFQALDLLRAHFPFALTSGELGSTFRF